MRTLSLFAVAACAASPAPPTDSPEPVRAAPARERAPAPELALPDLDGTVHRLRDLRGRVVVLEWTSPLCPAVAAVHEPWLVADTIAALDGEDTAWLQIDSSWFAAERKEAARRWRERLGLDVPFLLDPAGEVGRSFEAECTPTFVVVDPEGRVAWRGPLSDGAWGPDRRNLVLEAVRALLAGAEPPGGTPSERGCSVKYGPPRDGLTLEDYDEEAAARALYERAAAATSPEAALELLEQSFEAGLSRPTRVLADPAFATLARDGEARRALRRMLAPRPARGALTMVTPAEPGRPFVLCGTVRDAAGEPIPGAVVSLYHTDAAGWYSAGDTTGENPRLAGRVAADSRGRWRVRTILPERYADSDQGLRHVHMQFQADGYRSLSGQAASVYFEDDPNLRGAALREIRGDGCAILARRPDAEGVDLCVHDVVLRR